MTVDATNDPDLEINSGVEFPGDSLEPFTMTASVLEDDTLENSFVIIEVKDTSSFSFSFQKN